LFFTNNNIHTIQVEENRLLQSFFVIFFPLYEYDFQNTS
jgi:hypothetical protein